MKTNKNKIKEIIRDREEYYWNCDGKLCDYSVKVVNLKENKDYFLADIIVNNPHENEIQRFNECEYPKRLFNTIDKGQ